MPPPALVGNEAPRNRARNCLQTVTRRVGFFVGGGGGGVAGLFGGGGGGGSFLASNATNPFFGLSDLVGGNGEVDITLVQSPAPAPGAGLLSLALLTLMGATSRVLRHCRRG